MSEIMEAVATLALLDEGLDVISDGGTTFLATPALCQSIRQLLSVRVEQPEIDKLIKFLGQAGEVRLNEDQALLALRTILQITGKAYEGF